MLTRQDIWTLRERMKRSQERGGAGIWHTRLICADLAFLAGMMPAEIAGARMPDVDWRRGNLLIRAATGRRVVPLHWIPELSDDLDAWCNMRWDGRGQAADDPLVVTLKAKSPGGSACRGKGITRQQVAKYLQTACRVIGTSYTAELGPLTFAAEAIRAGIPIDQVQAASGMSLEALEAIAARRPVPAPFTPTPNRQ